MIPVGDDDLDHWDPYDGHELFELMVIGAKVWVVIIGGVLVIDLALSAFPVVFPGLVPVLFLITVPAMATATLERREAQRG